MTVKIILSIVYIFLGFLMGNMVVYLFNHIPLNWVTDYESEEPERKYIKSIPWKYVLSGFFICIMLAINFNDTIYAADVGCTSFVLVFISMCDIKYRIIPDQLNVCLIVIALGYINYNESVKSMILGLAFGVLISLIIFGLSKLLFKKDGIGGGDLKLYASIGFMVGLSGIITIFLLTTIISGVTFLVSIILKRSKFEDSKPLAPYISLSTLIYLLVLYKYVNAFVIQL